MDLVSIFLFSALEVALLLALVVFILRRKNMRLQRELAVLQEEEPAAEASGSKGFESIDSGYLPYLEKQIIDNRARFELLETESTDDERLEKALTDRLAFLEAEKKVAEFSNDYPERHWEHVIEHFAPEQPEAEQDVVDEEAMAGDDQQPDPTPRASVSELLEALGQQGDAMASLRTVFEQVKGEPDTESLEKLEAQIKELERRYTEANTCVEMMEQENRRLQARLEEDERLLQEQMSADEVEFRQQIGKQKDSVTELQTMVGELQLEADKASQLQAKIDQFDRNAREMNICIQIMEEENEFLRDQVQALLQLDQEAPAKDAGDAEAIEELQAKLQESEKKVASLEANLATLEKEYLALHDEAKTGSTAA